MSTAKTDSVFRIVKAIALREKQGAKREARSPQSKLIYRLYAETVAFPFAIAVFLGILKKSSDKFDWVNATGLTALMISYVGLFIIPVSQCGFVANL